MPEVVRYPSELGQRAVKMVFEVRERSGQEKGAAGRGGRPARRGRKTPHNWVPQAEIDSGPVVRTGGAPGPRGRGSRRPRPRRR